ncbi:MAG: hypothetical protein F6J89_23050 [Symploca sp. SIO1C4]|uniref:CpcD-like domain-containing protein n=1 Tax=Symploca sp. SIO1C4 TaxID=2607765 RepID=A0A6B3NFJ5_9CYAN|nr:hypothetical protein [Symploca sp. SIO1C4]
MLGLANTVAISMGDYNSRIVSIEVTGICHKGMRTSNYTLKVPYNRLSQAMQYLKRLGGTIVSVKLVSSSLTETESAKPSTIPQEKIPLEVESPATYQAQKADIIRAKPLQRSRNRSALKKTTRSTNTRRRRTIKGQTRV